jgi:lysophospholipase
MAAAPLFEDVADAPEGGEARWLTTSDGVRIRAALWAPVSPTPAAGSVFLFPGRTEYVEKYGTVARHYTRAGYTVLIPDWRGQGLSARALPDARLGHVETFTEYQQDVAALADFAKRRALPEPWNLVAHSMGACIGLRALLEGLPVRAAAFSAPMWGIKIAVWEIPLAWSSALVAPSVGLGGLLTPRTGIEHLVSGGAFAGNDLTTDRARWDDMKAQIDRYPDLALGGPTLSWLRAALLETRRLARKPAPAVPAVTFLGTRERVVSPRAVHRRMARWPGGRLEVVPAAEHEIMMERADVRQRFLDASTALFAAQA